MISDALKHMRALSAGAALVALLGLASQAMGAQELDRIIAIVDEDVVLASELIERVQYVEMQFQSNDMQVPPRDVLMSQVLERLIVDSIQMQMGRRAGVRISDQELTQAVSNIAQQSGMGLEQFQQALAADGMTYAEFRDQIRREMIVARVQQNRVMDRIHVSPQELQNFMDSPVGQAATSDEYRVGHILLAIPDDASQQAVLQAEQEANQIVEELRDGADFAQMAAARSAGQRALQGGDLGWRQAGQIPSLFAEAVLNSSRGDVLEPVRSASGFHVVKVLDTRGASGTVVDQVRARHILVQPSEIRSEAEAENLVHDLHARLQDGESFSQLAQDYSDDPGSALGGGDLGWVTQGQMVPAFENTMNETRTGEMSEPFRSQFGWHVLQVTDRRSQDMSSEFRERQALRILQERRYDEALEAWLQEIRDEAYVEVRI